MSQRYQLRQEQDGKYWSMYIYDSFDAKALMYRFVSLDKRWYHRLEPWQRIRIVRARILRKIEKLNLVEKQRQRIIKAISEDHEYGEG